MNPYLTLSVSCLVSRASYHTCFIIDELNWRGGEREGCFSIDELEGEERERLREKWGGSFPVRVRDMLDIGTSLSIHAPGAAAVAETEPASRQVGTIYDSVGYTI